MGRIAGAADARSGGLTFWAQSLADLPNRISTRVALVLPAAAMADWPLPTGCPGAVTVRQQRSIGRRRLLAALTGRLDGNGELNLVAGEDGIRRLAGSAWFASVAEREGWFAAVVARTPVGIDLESEAEAAASDVVLDGIVSIDRTRWSSLAAIWASREATLKAIGRDLTGDPGGWRFGVDTATPSGCAPHRVDIHAFDGMAAAVAYVGI